MLISMTGLHASGKSYFTKSIPPKFGFQIYNKKEVISNLCLTETGRTDWDVWYREEFKKDAYLVTSKIIDQIPQDKDSILDAVHSYNEWRIIKSIIPDALLAVVTTPQHIRSTRWEAGDKIKDIQRIKYWHSVYGEDIGCLLSMADWSFNGAASQETNTRSFCELISLEKSRRYIARQGINQSTILLQEKERGQ